VAWNKIIKGKTKMSPLIFLEDLKQADSHVQAILFVDMKVMEKMLTNIAI